MSDSVSAAPAPSAIDPGSVVWRSLVQQLPDSVLAFDVELRLLAFNEASRTSYARVGVTGLREGMTAGDVFAADSPARERFLAYLTRALEGESWEHLQHFEPDDSWWQVSYRPLRAADGTITGALQVARDVTLRQAETQLERERLRAVLDALPVGVWIADQAGRFVARNQAGRDIWGEDAPMSQRTDDYGKDYRAWRPDGTELTSEEWALARAIREGDVTAGEELEIAAWDGERRTVLNYALPIHDAAGGMVGGVAVNVDITARRRAERALALSQERYRILVESAGVGIVLTDADAHILEANASFARLLHCEPATLTGRSVFELTHPDDASAELALVEQVRAGEIDRYALDKRFLTCTGEPVWTSVTAVVVRDANGEVRFAVGIVQDITTRKQVEQELLAREETIRRQLAEIEAIYDSAPTGMAVFDREFRFVRVNEQLARVNGLPREAHIGRTVRAMVPDIAADVEPLLRRVLDTGEPIRDMEISGETPAQPGVKRYWLEHFYPVRLPSTGEVVGVNATAEEITARKQEQLTREFLSEASAVLASSLDYQTTLSRIARLAVPFMADYCIVDVLEDDGSIRRVAGWHVDPEMQPLLDQALRVPPPPESANPAARVIRTGQAEWTAHMDPTALREVYEGREQVREIIAQLRPHSYVAVPMMAAGRVLGSIMLISSCSARRYGAADIEPALELARRAGAAVFNARQHTMTQQARHEAELASLTKSQFLATMSHELRTPLTGIVGYTELLQEEVSGPLTERQRLQLDRIKASAWHLVTIIDEILLFARVEAGREQVRSTQLDLSALVQESVGIMETHARAKHLDLTLDLPPAPLSANTDQGKVRQILLNLLGNALKFTDEGGVHVQLFQHERRGFVRVRDTGPGIPADQAQRIFEPFTQADSSNTRTKGGTGLGLTVSRRLAELLGGSLVLEYTSTAGSAFVLSLPLDDEGADHVLS